MLLGTMGLNAGSDILCEIKARTRKFQVNLQPMGQRVFVLSGTRLIEAANI